MGFPTSPGDGDEYTTILGTVYKYRDSDDCWYIINEFLELDGIEDVVIDSPADNEGLHWDSGSSRWINQTAAEAGLALASELHTEDHNNTHHTTNYHTETDGTGAVTIHSGITDAGSGIIISTGERTALHDKYLDSDAVTAVATADDYVKNDGDIIYGNLEIRSASDGMFSLRSTVDGGNPGTPEAGWNYIQFKDKDGDRQGYFGIDSGGNFRFQPEIAGGGVLIMTELSINSNKITSLANGTVSTDAMAFGQKYTLEQHDNTYHSTNYEPAFSKNDAFNKDWGTIAGTVAQGNDSRFHTIYSLEVHNNTKHSPNYEAEFSKNTAFNKDFGITATEVTVGNDSRIQDALKIQGVTVDDTDKANTKILKYNSVSGNLEYEDDATGGAGGDTDAIHDNVADEITAITPKTTPVDADEFVIEDSEASFAKKALTFGNLKAAAGADPEGIASDDIIFSNDPERDTLSLTYVKVKEIAVYRKMKVRVSWHFRRSSNPSVNVWTRLYINGVGVGSEYNTIGSVGITVSEDVEVDVNDLLQVYGKTENIETKCSTKEQRIKGIEYVSNDP